VPEPNTNANTYGDTVTVSLGSGDSVEAIPVADAARLLGVTLPRLQRTLKHPEFFPHVLKTERPTKTGTRTVTVISVSVMDALKAALSEGDGEQKRKQSHPEAFVFSPGEAEQRHRAALELLTREYSDRIEEQGRTITDLRRDKEDLRGEREKLLEELKQERERALLLASEVEKLKALPAMEQMEAQGNPGGDSGGSVVSGRESAPQSPQGRRFWQFWRKG
jgi:hypothetical protein